MSNSLETAPSPPEQPAASDLMSVSRSDVIVNLESEFHTNVLENPGRNWRRVNTSVVEQCEAEISAALTDFHLFELYRDGSYQSICEGDYETGAHVEDLLLPGSLSYVQPHVPVRQWSESGNATIQQVYIDESIFRDAAAAFTSGDPDQIRTRAFQAVFDPRLKMLCDALLEEARCPSPGGDLYSDSIAQQIAVLVLRRQFGDLQKELKKRRLSERELGRIVDHLEADLSDTGGTDTLAGLLDMDVFSFTRAFRETTGQTPHQFVIERRMHRTREMVVNSTDSLADIAYATGFSSQAHMTACFSKHFGKPPGVYRREHRK